MRRHTIDEMKERAASRGGVCLSDVYVNVHSKLRWRCAKGHEWETVPKLIIQGSWCPKCSGKEKHTIEKYQSIAASREGVCLSDVYVNATTKLKWRCAEGHEWEATPSDIKNNGTWCRKCGYVAQAEKARKYSIEDMQKLAANRGGFCESSTFESVDKKLKWRCAEGHEWEAVPASMVHQGSWCPYCSPYFTERLCRHIFELLYGQPFSKKRPKWLKLSTGKPLELDGYAEELALAFEYHGKQHFEYVEYFPEKLERRQVLDMEKRRLCESNGVTLIEIPYTVDRGSLESFIRQECDRENIVVPRKEEIQEEELKGAYLTSSKILSELRELAKSRGGKLLSTRYLGSLTKMNWKCSEGHTWPASVNNVKNQNNWCPHCAQNTPDTIEVMMAIASAKGGECLSKEYVNQTTKLLWRCAEGHEWKAIPRNVKNLDRWCPYCSGRKLWARHRDESEARLEELQNIAHEKGGLLLSDSYSNSASKYLWQCHEGHQWEATADNVKKVNGTWCPYCSGNKLWTPR